MTASPHRVVTSCRVCAARSFAPVVSLGRTPLANAFVDPADAQRPEATFPLEVIRCRDCGLVQLGVVVDPEILFREYRYATSASRPMVEHFEAYAAEIRQRFVPAGGLAVEVGSNDGVLLRALTARDVRVVGIEPARNLAETANAAGLETWSEFFGADVARRLATDRGKAHAILANNVLAHVDDLDGVLAGVDTLLASDGVLVIEVPYVLDLLERVEYDTVYHEHLSYFALEPLRRLFARTGLEFFDARRLSVHGGSIRVFVGRRGRHVLTGSLRTLLAQEAAAHLDDSAVYSRFAERVAASRVALRELVAGLRADRRRIAALGASAKGNTLLNYCALTAQEVEFVADSTPLKHGLLTPGAHIPVRPERAIAEERPDCTLLLAWNYADAIIARFADYVAGGGRFIHPIPLARLVP